MNRDYQTLFEGILRVAFQADGHLTDTSIMLAIDGELSAPDCTLVKAHLRACWACRNRKDRLARTINDIVDYEQALDVPLSGGKAIFMARLNQLAAELGSPSMVRGWIAMLLRFHPFRSAMLPQVALSAMIVLGAIVLLLGLFPHDAAVVSAAELLRRAADSESSALIGINQPIIVQKLSIKVNGRVISKTLYHDASFKRQAHSIEAGASEEYTIKQGFQRSLLNWDYPLSPRAYSHWRDGAVKKQDSVTRLGGDRLRLDTTASSGPIAEASFTVRAADYHPIAEDLRLPDSTEIEVVELSYAVVGLSTLDPSIFGESSPAEPLHPSLRALMPDPAQVAIAELQARTALHHIGADLGETITVETDANGRVLVEGITEDESRKQQIADALKDIRFTDLRIESVQQMAVQQVPAARPLRSVIVAGVGSPLLEEQLKQQFPNASERMEYVNRSLDLCQRASARAWALNRLADRYTAKQVALLPEEEQHELQNLLIEHISTLQEDVERLRNQLAPVVSFTSNSATAGDAEVGRSPGASLPGGNARSDDWRDRIHRIHASVETANEAATSLLAGTTEDGDTSDKLQLNLDSAVNRLRLELQLLDKQVRRGL